MQSSEHIYPSTHLKPSMQSGCFMMWRWPSFQITWKMQLNRNLVRNWFTGSCYFWSVVYLQWEIRLNWLPTGCILVIHFYIKAFPVILASPDFTVKLQSCSNYVTVCVWIYTFLFEILNDCECIQSVYGKPEFARLDYNKQIACNCQLSPIRLQTDSKLILS